MELLITVGYTVYKPMYIYVGSDELIKLQEMSACSRPVGGLVVAWVSYFGDLDMSSMRRRTVTFSQQVALHECSLMSETNAI